MKDKSKVCRKYKRVVLTGNPSIGKSSAMAVIAKKAIVIDVNHRWPNDCVEKHDFPEFVETYSGVKDALGDILAKDSLPHDFIVLDTASDLMKLIRQHSVSVDFSGNSHNYHDYSKGDKSYAPNYMNEILSLLDRIGDKHGTNIGIVCHTAAKPQGNPIGKDYQKFCLDLPERVGAAVMQWADVVGFAYQDVVVAQDGLKMKGKAQARVITFTDSPAFEAKSGLQYPLPEKIPFDKEGKWADLVFGKRPLVNELEALFDQYPEDKREGIKAKFEGIGFRTLPDEQLKGLVEETKKYLNQLNGVK